MMQTKSQEAGKWVFRIQALTDLCFGATLVQQRITIFGSFFQGIDGSTLATHKKFLKNKTLMISLTHELIITKVWPKLLIENKIKMINTTSL
jgi:hypothetical protein